MSDRELEEIKRRKLEELRALMEQKRREEEQTAAEVEKVLILRRILTPEARSRLANLRLIRPQLVAALENYLISLYQMGRITRQITDDELKRILARLVRKREYRIKRL